MGGRPNDARLNDFLVVLRTVPAEEFLTAVSRAGANAELDPSQLQRVRLEPINGGTSFRLGDEDVLSPRWPRSLQSPEFAAGRVGYEKALGRARNAVAQNGTMGYMDGEYLSHSVGQLRSEFLLAFPKSRRTQSSTVFHDYTVSVAFLDDLQLRIDGLEADDPDLLRRRAPFAGGTLGELVEYVVDEELRFALRERADRATYERLYLAMRDMVESRDGTAGFADAVAPGQAVDERFMAPVGVPVSGRMIAFED